MVVAPNFKAIKEDILEVLRNNRTHEEMDEFLGCLRGNYKRWEQSKLGLSWSLLVSIAEKNDVHLRLKLVNGYKGEDLKQVPPFLNYMMRGMTQDEYCRRTGNSRATLNRWLAEESEPTVEQIFKILFMVRQSLFTFLERHFEVQKFKRSHDWIHNMLGNYLIYKKHPDMEFIRFSGLHEDFVSLESLAQRLSKRLGMENEKVFEIIDGFLKVGAWKLHNGKVDKGEFFSPPLYSPANFKENLDRMEAHLRFFMRFITPENLKSEKVRAHRTIKTVGPIQFRKCHRIVHSAYQEIDELLTAYESQEKPILNEGEKLKEMVIILALQNMGESLNARMDKE